ncbi:pleiotropic drug resistance protein 1-like [Dorcoceras hygrometricum]|uniref:Pleiotropic drug resistance protein 1-like n=1 Tax=Dorcoceras hygrometricum TaxID=472368 RepID=A0A2Z7CZU3_9LAMI|nr:pleiotropic drug resistance protein 1-like [Dorcoceras hygrometricum]
MKQGAREEATSYGDSAGELMLMTSSVTSSSRKNQQQEDVAMEIISRREESAGSNSIQSRAIIYQLLLRIQSQEIQAQRIEEEAKRSSRRVKSAAKQLTHYQSWMSTAELNSKWRKRQEACKEKDASTFTLQSSVAPKWKEDKIAFWSAEEFLEAFQREEIQQRLYILEATPFEAALGRRPVERRRWCYYILWEIFIDYTVHQQRENNLK